MDKQEILNKVDHTILTQTATWEDIKKICDDGIKFKTASVCIPPCYVTKARQYVGENLKICTVIGFPNGYSTTKTKVFETEEAVRNGADEIDMVINIAELKNKNYEYVENEIKMVKAACDKRILKVIIETCLLTEEEKIKMCEIIKHSGADFIKTSTGFSTEGAKFDDIKLFKENLKGSPVMIKAAGGITGFEDAQKFIELGANRLGTSRLVKLMKE